jgi:hypothetical protein
MLNAAWLMGQVPLRRVGAWDRASMESARPCMQLTLPWTAAHTVHETTIVCILAAAVETHDSSLDDCAGRQTTWGGLPWVESPTKVRMLPWRRAGLHAPKNPALERDSQRILLRDLLVIAPFACS